MMRSYSAEPLVEVTSGAGLFWAGATRVEREPVPNDEHIAFLRRGVTVWNEWRRCNADIKPELAQAQLSGTSLHEADLSEANLTQANLSFADLSQADLGGAELSRANLTHADLVGAALFGTNLRETFLYWTNLTGAHLIEPDLSGAKLLETIFGNIYLGDAVGLDNCKHLGPSVIDFRTLVQSENLPISFLRGCGLPDTLIEQLPSLSCKASEFYSCFISYSGKDQVFAERLHADLQDNGVRCWFAPHDLPIGAKTWDAIDEAIRLRDKLLIILSDASIASDWVEDEVSKAFAEERERNATILFPIRIDNVVMTTAEPWAVKLRDQRHIGDFRSWKEDNQYQTALERLLRDLKMPG
jgi:uncharacterized protein YjbI with pentapeptide repeats